MKTMAIPTIRFFASVEVAAIAKESSDPQNRQELAGAGTMQSSLLEAASGAELSQSGRPIKNWQRAQVPTTVLKALTKAGVYPGMRAASNRSGENSPNGMKKGGWGKCGKGLMAFATMFEMAETQEAIGLNPSRLHSTRPVSQRTFYAI